jgi:acetyltransferase-like isoleucine patch superfamily enzyme
VRLIRWRLRLGKRLELGRNVTIGPAAVLVPPRRLAIRDNVGIARGFHVEVDLEIGPDVLISSQVAVVGKDHRFDDPTRTVYWAGRLPASSLGHAGSEGAASSVPAPLLPVICRRIRYASASRLGRSGRDTRSVRIDEIRCHR